MDERDDEPFVERMDVRLSLVEVVVLDQSGRHVHGLPSSAFRLFDGAQPVPLQTFDEIELAESASPARRVASGANSIGADLRASSERRVRCGRADFDGGAGCHCGFGTGERPCGRRRAVRLQCPPALSP